MKPTILFFTLVHTVVALRLPSSLTTFAPEHAEHFHGGLLGVTADVKLCLSSQRAHITLKGLPLGGTLAGTARFHNGEGSDVQIDEPLRGALKRRLVKIVRAEFDRRKDVVFVTVTLPFLLGTHTLALNRNVNSQRVDCTPLLL